MMPFAATWIDLEIIILSEVREREISYDIAYMWSLKNDINELVYKTERDSQTQKTNMITKGRRCGGMNYFRIKIYTLHIRDNQAGPTG